MRTQVRRLSGRAHQRGKLAVAGENVQRQRPVAGRDTIGQSGTPYCCFRHRDDDELASS
jgi:hypothetical protein